MDKALKELEELGEINDLEDDIDLLNDIIEEECPGQIGDEWEIE